MEFFKSEPTMRQALAKIRGVKTAGERRKILDDHFGFDSSARGGHRCLKCRDTGWATIYHPRVIVQEVTNQEKIEWWRTLVVVCACPAADGVAAETKRKKPLPVYGSQDWHFAVNEPDSRAAVSAVDLSRIGNVKRYEEFEQFS